MNAQFKHVEYMNSGVKSMHADSEQELITAILNRLTSITNELDAGEKVIHADELRCLAGQLYNTLEAAE